MTYQDALNYLYDPRRVKGERSLKAGAERTLAPMADALAALGDPHTRFRALHIAGSKGKGSTSAMLAAILRAQGYRVGLYTSPHLHTYRERMQINGVMPTEDEIVARLDRLRPVFDARPELITFELSTLIAFTWFADQGIDIGVIEVGLGGRLDATNVITPEVSIITQLSLEHTDILGKTIAAIAGEKAGIIKPGAPVVVSPNAPEAMAVVEAKARRENAPLTRVGVDVPFRLGEPRPDGQWFEVDLPGRPAQRYWLPLLGPHQVANAATAVAAIDVGRGRGLAVADEAVDEGLREVRWPARLEILSRQPLVIVDGAHTPEAAAFAVETLRRHLGFQKLLLVFGALQDKDVSGMLDALLPAASAVVVTRSRYPRAIPADELAGLVQARGVTPAQVCDDVPEALDAALALAEPDDVALVTGSLFVAAAAREAWARRVGAPLPPMDPPMR